MDYLKFFGGLLVFFVFVGLLWRNSKQKGFASAIFSFDIVLGLIAGLYLIISSVAAVL